MRSLWFLSVLWLLIVGSTRADTGPSEVKVAVGGTTTVRYTFDADVAWIARGNPDAFDGTSTAVDARTLDITLRGLQAGTGQLVIGLGGRGVVVKVTVGEPAPPMPPPGPIPIPPLPGPGAKSPPTIPPGKVGQRPFEPRPDWVYRPTIPATSATSAARASTLSPGSTPTGRIPMFVLGAGTLGGTNCPSGSG